MGILDANFAPAPLGLGILSAASAFPDVPTAKQQSPEEMWAAIEAANAKANAEADRRNAAGQVAANSVVGNAYQPFPAPDQTSPAIQMATGNTPLAVDPASLAHNVPFGALAPPAASPTAPPSAPSIPLPVPRPVSAPPATVDDATIPANATLTEGTLPSGADVPQTSALGRMGDLFSGAVGKIRDNSNMLLGLASGLAGAPSLGVGLGRGFAAAIPGSQLDQKQQLFNQQQAGIPAQYQALVSAGVPKRQALAALYNPKIMESVVTSYLGDRKQEIKTVKDGLGNERLVAVNPYDPTQSKEVASSNGAAGSGPAPAQVEPNYDPVTKRDEGFLKTLDPTTAAAVKDIADGNMSGTGRNLQKLMPYVARYEMGFSNGTYTARNKFNTEFGSQSPSTVGGQKVLMGTALGHLGEAADAAADLNNNNGLGSADLGYITNAIGNRTTANAAKANSLNDKVAKFSGEVGKLYSGSSGGGVHEREESRSRLGSNLTSAELAAGLESNRDLILSKQQALQQQATDLFGPEGAKRFDFIGPEGRKSLEKIEAAIGRLKGTAPATSSPAVVAPGKYSWSPDKGLQAQ